jgi:hypothetical protein
MAYRDRREFIDVLDGDRECLRVPCLLTGCMMRLVAGSGGAWIGGLRGRPQNERRWAQ